MKNMTIAVAIGAISVMGSATAKTSVTLFGRVDAGLQYQSVEIENFGKATVSGMHSGGQAGNRWGLMGSEDLDNGLKAIFMLEAGFNLENGTVSDAGRSAFNRQAFVGLSSDHWGTLTLGRQYNFGFNFFADIGPFGNNYALAAQPVTYSTAMVRYDNMLKYVTPTYHGWKAGIGFSKNTGFAGETYKVIKDSSGTNKVDDTVSGLTAGVRYDGGPIAFTADFDQLTKVPDISGKDTGSIKSWLVGGSYDFDIMKLSVSYGEDRGGRIGAVSTNINKLGNVVPVPNARHVEGFKARNYQVGLSAPLAGGTLMAAWLKSASNHHAVTAGGNGIGSQQSLSLGYSYALSKRTNLYAVATYVSNPAYIDNAKSQEYRIGMHHKF